MKSPVWILVLCLAFAACTKMSSSTSGPNDSVSGFPHNPSPTPPPGPTPSPFPVPLTTPVTDYKPEGTAAATAAQTACNLLSQISAERGIKKLIIAFEGLLSYDDSGTQEVYQYLWNVQNGQPATQPGSGSAGYVLHELLVPYFEAHPSDAEFLVFSWDTQSNNSGSTAEICADAWMSVAGRSLIIVGHSYGGDAANQLASVLQTDGNVPIQVLTIDPRLAVGSFQRTSNASVWDNFLQTNTPFLNGSTVPGADENVDLSSSGVGHTGMPGMPQVMAALLQLIN